MKGHLHTVLRLAAPIRAAKIAVSKCDTGNRDLLKDLLSDMGFLELHFHLRRAGRISQKHLRELLAHWVAQGLGPSRVAKRLSNLHWLFKQMGRYDLVPEFRRVCLGSES